MFYRVECGGAADVDEARFKYFVEKVDFKILTLVDTRYDPINSENKNNLVHPIIL